MFGLPSLPSGFFNLNSVTVGVLGQLESLAWSYIEQPLSWKILEFDTESVAYEADNFIEFNFQTNAEVSNIPISEGSFASYNKVERPFEIRCTLAVWGVPSTRLKFLSWLEKAKREALKLRILTPETVYSPVTLAGYSMPRSVNSGNVTRVLVECRFVEVREVPISYFNPQTGKCDTSDAQNPEDMPKKPDKYTSPQEKVFEGVKKNIDKANTEFQKLQDDVAKKIKEVIG